MRKEKKKGPLIQIENQQENKHVNDSLNEKTCFVLFSSQYVNIILWLRWLRETGKLSLPTVPTNKKSVVTCQCGQIKNW